MLFLMPNQQCQSFYASTGKSYSTEHLLHAG